MNLWSNILYEGWLLVKIRIYGSVRAPAHVSELLFNSVMMFIFTKHQNKL